MVTTTICLERSSTGPGLTGGHLLECFGDIKGCSCFSWFVDCICFTFVPNAMFSSSPDKALEETIPACKLFLQLAESAQKLHSSSPSLSQEVKDASTNVDTLLSKMESGRGRVTGKFNFGVGREGRGLGGQKDHH